jgi:hypothetical protein
MRAAVTEPSPMMKQEKSRSLPTGETPRQQAAPAASGAAEPQAVAAS